MRVLFGNLRITVQSSYIFFNQRNVSYVHKYGKSRLKIRIILNQIFKKN
jgi:hypothetical protein